MLLVFPKSWSLHCANHSDHTSCLGRFPCPHRPHYPRRPPSSPVVLIIPFVPRRPRPLRCPYHPYRPYRIRACVSISNEIPTANKFVSFVQGAHDD